MKPAKFFLPLLATLLIQFHIAKATHYAPKFEGRKMANGQVFHERDMVAASNIWPLGTKLRVMNLMNGRTIYVTVQDRTAKREHVLDLSSAACERLGITRTQGWTLVTMTEDRSGSCAVSMTSGPNL